MKGRGFGDDRFVRMVFCFFNCNERERVVLRVVSRVCEFCFRFFFGVGIWLRNNRSGVFCCCVGVRREHGNNFCFFS